MYYTIYKTINLINNKFYIGKHVTENPNDEYMGSGERIRYAIEKYGIQNFKKEILFIFDNEEEMNLKEKEILTPKFLAENKHICYNIAAGGQGGNIALFPENPKYEEICLKISEGLKNNPKLKENIRKQHKNNPNYAMKGKQQSDKQKATVSKKIKEFWKNHINITNGTLNKTLEKGLEIPEGWRRGKTLNKIKQPYFWITNGKENKQNLKNDPIPKGWIKGKTKLKRYKIIDVSGEKNPMYGKQQTIETRKKISFALKGKQSPMKGKIKGHWYSNGIENKILFPDEVPNGWKRGRTFKKK